MSTRHRVTVTRIAAGRALVEVHDRAGLDEYPEAAADLTHAAARLSAFAHSGEDFAHGGTFAEVDARLVPVLRDALKGATS